MLISYSNSSLKEIQTTFFIQIIYQSNEKHRLTSELYQEGILVSPKRGGQLEGGPSRKFLKFDDSLELALQQHSIDAHVSGPPYIEVIWAFNQVVHRSLGMELADGWEGATKKLTLYRELRSEQDTPGDARKKKGIMKYEWSVSH